MSPVMLAEDRPVGRAFVCGGCGESRLTATLAGPFPHICDACLGPDATADRERARHQARANRRRTASRVIELEQRVADLQELLGGQTGGRANRYGEPGRAALARAIRHLTRRDGGARGHADFADALLTVSDIARAWAARISLPKVDPDPDSPRLGT